MLGVLAEFEAIGVLSVLLGVLTAFGLPSVLGVISAVRVRMSLEYLVYLDLYSLSSKDKQVHALLHILENHISIFLKKAVA